MTLDDDGGGRFTQIVLRPLVRLADEADRSRLAALNGPAGPWKSRMLRLPVGDYGDDRNPGGLAVIHAMPPSFRREDGP